MKYRLLWAVWSLLAIASAAFADPTPAPAPAIVVGVDAQPLGNFDRVKAIANTLVRYDPGPQRNDTPTDYLTVARIKKLKVEIQGTAADRFAVDLRQFADVVAKVLQDDEPDLSRWKAGVFDPSIYTPTDAPHPSTVGYTKPDVLAARYKAWKLKTPAFPVSVNLNGQSLTSLYYAPPLAWHSAYIKASDECGFDLHVKNIGKDPSLFQGPYLIEKLRAAGGNPTHVYIEASDQKLGKGGRGPTPNEQGTSVWGALGHGVTEVIYFPQQIGGTFSYWAMTPENEARAKDDYAAITKYSALLSTGTRSITNQSPKFTVDYSKGKATWPETETFIWQGQGERLEVTVDYVGGTAPVIRYSGTPTPAPTPNESELVKQLAAAKAELVAAKAAVESANTALAEKSAALIASQLDLTATRTERDVAVINAQSAAATLNAQRDAVNAAAADMEAAAAKAKAAVSPVTVPATKPTTRPSAIYLTVPAPEGTSFQPYAWGHGAVLNSVKAPGVEIASKSPYEWEEARIRAYARICRDGGTVDQRWIAGAGVVVIAAGSPLVIDVEGYHDPNSDALKKIKRDRPDLDKAKVAAIFRQYVLWAKDEVQGKCPVGVIGYPLWDGDADDGAVYRPVHDACDFVSPPDTYTNGPQWLDRDFAISEAASLRTRKLYPDKPQHIWLNPLYADAASTEKTPEAGARELVHARVLAGADGAVVVWTPRDPGPAVRVYGGMK